jgi:hypothetical protein
MGKSVQAVDVPRVPTEEWFNTLSPEERKLLAMFCVMGEQYFTIQPIQWDPSPNESSTRQDMFSVQHSTQPVLPPAMPLESRLALQKDLLTLLEDLLNPKQNDKQQCYDAAMSVGASVEPDTKESDSQPLPRKMQSSNAVIPTDRSESQE